MKEAVLEPFLRRRRIARVLPVLRGVSGVRLLDVGCGPLHRFLDAVSPDVASGVGVDQKVQPGTSGNLSFVRARLNDRLPFPDASFDVVTLLAVLEHLAEPEAILAEISRVLVPGGRLALTVPHHRSKPVLEFLAYRLHIVSEEEIRDHKRYWGRPELTAALSAAGLTVEQYRTFQLGFNNFCVARR